MAGTQGVSASIRCDPKPESFAVCAYPLVEAQDREIGKGGPSHQSARQMKGIEGADGLEGERAASPFQYFVVELEQIPVRRRGGEAGPTIRGVRFCKDL